MGGREAERWGVREEWGSEKSGGPRRVGVQAVTCLMICVGCYLSHDFLRLLPHHPDQLGMFNFRRGSISGLQLELGSRVTLGLSLAAAFETLSQIYEQSSKAKSMQGEKNTNRGLKPNTNKKTKPKYE